MANFCANCGNKLRKEDNFCVNCGAKIDKSDLKQHNPSLNQYYDSKEKNKAKKELKRVVGGRLIYNKNFSNTLAENGLDIVHDREAIIKQVEKEIDLGLIKSGGVEFRVNQLILEYKKKKEKEEIKLIRQRKKIKIAKQKNEIRIAKQKEEEKKILKKLDELFESDEIKSKLRKNNIGQTGIISIKDNLKNKLIDIIENMNEEELKSFIITQLEKEIKELEKARIEKEKERIIKEMEENELTRGGYCSSNCRHYYENFYDGEGRTPDDPDFDGYIGDDCNLGHSLQEGSFCKDYE